jgi:hypothetical protein
MTNPNPAFARARRLALICALGLSPLFAPGAETTPTLATTETVPMLAYDTSRGGGAFGPSMCMDPAFAFYESRPLAETFAAMRARGITAVQVTDTGDLGAPLHAKIAAAVRAAGLTPVLRVYPPTDVAIYRAHPEWRQRMLGGVDGKFDWRVYVCPSRPEVVRAYAEKIVASMHAGAYDGVQLAEPWFEQWGGPEVSPGKPRAAYACVCDACVAAFRARSGVDAREMLTRRDSPVYWRKEGGGREAYLKWVDYRAEMVTTMTRELARAAREARPGATVNVMVLSDARVEPGKAREYQAIDVDRLVLDVQPDILTLQDAWQDWTRPPLPASFVVDYARAYREPLLKLKPDLFIMSHADIGSAAASKRSWEWIRSFAGETVKSGLGAPSFYEWSVSTIAN